MPNTFKPKRSNTPLSIPTTADLIDGELAVNSADKIIYIRDGEEIIGLSNYIDPYWSQTDVGIHTLSNVGVGTTNPTSKLTVDGDVLVSGVITATSFYGDGSNLTGVVATGSGIEILDDDSLIGTATTINFGTGISVSPISGGTVTVTSSVDTYWVQTDVGIHTLSNVGVGTTNPTTALTVQGDVLVSGVVTATNIPKYYFQSNAPSSPNVGDKWVDDTDGITYIYYNDGNSSQWIEFGPTPIEYTSASGGGESISPFLLMGA